MPVDACACSAVPVHAERPAPCEDRAAMLYCLCLVVSALAASSVRGGGPWWRPMSAVAHRGGIHGDRVHTLAAALQVGTEAPCTGEGAPEQPERPHSPAPHCANARPSTRDHATPTAPACSSRLPS